MSRTIATALPVWLAVVAAVLVGAVAMPSDQWWAVLPAIAGGAMIMTFVIQVSLQSKDGLVMRMLVTVTGAILLLIAASLATLLITTL